MSQELIHVIDQISKEKGISKEMVIEAVESALVSAAKKKYGTQRIAVQIDGGRVRIRTQIKKSREIGRASCRERV